MDTQLTVFDSSALKKQLPIFHFVASVLDSENVPLKQIQLILGHSKPTTTDRYLGNIHKGQKEYMEKISEALVPENKKEANDENR